MTRSGNVIAPEDGYVLTLDGMYSDRVYLSELDSPERWRERVLDRNILQKQWLYLDFFVGQKYSTGDRVRFDGSLYRCLAAHTAQAGWTPEAAPSLWAKVLIPDPEAIPEWEQPDSTNAYMMGDKVAHNGKTWTSTTDNNVWEPGVYGWEETEE